MYFISMISLHLITVKLKWAFQVKDSWFLSDQLYKRMKAFLVFGCWMFLFSSLLIWTAFECVVILTGWAYFVKLLICCLFSAFKIVFWFNTILIVLTWLMRELASNKWSQFCGNINSVLCDYLNTNARFQTVSVEQENSAQCCEKGEGKLLRDNLLQCSLIRCCSLTPELQHHNKPEQWP